jgi:hypothetical protein
MEDIWISERRKRMPRRFGQTNSEEFLTPMSSPSFRISNGSSWYY